MTALRQLLPAAPGPPPEADPAAAHAALDRSRPDGRPWVALNMVVSLDGATAVAGRSGGLGGAADKAVFSALRAVADVVVAAAGTVRVEGYGAPRTPPSRRAERLERGQTAYPRLAVVSASLDLDPAQGLFADAVEPPLVYTVRDAPPERVRRLAPVAEVVHAGEGRVDVTEMIDDLGRRGARTVLVEGGPVLNGHLQAADLVDELDLTIAPLLAGGPSHRLTVGAPELARTLRLAHLWEADGSLFARYTRDGEGGG